MNKLKEDSLFICSKFEKYANQLYLQNEYNFILKIKTIKNIKIMTKFFQYILYLIKIKP